MKLRTRLALTTVAIAIPLALGVFWIERQVRGRALAELMSAHVAARLEGHGREWCERSPETWSRPMPPWQHASGAWRPPGLEGTATPPLGPPPLPPIQAFPFDARLRPSVSFAPPLDPTLVAQVRAGATVARAGFRVGRREGDAMLVRTAWGTGPCAWVLVRHRHPPWDIGMLGFVLRLWGAPLLAMVLAVVLGLGPLVRRIRLLAARVRTSAAQRYREPLALGGSDEVAELAMAFEDAAREVRGHLEAQERREQALRDWLANTAHDVMTPLTVLQGHLSTLQRTVTEGGLVDASVVAAAMDEAHYTASLMHNLGVAARLEAGEPHLVKTRVDLGALVERVVGRHRPVAKQHDVQLEVAVPEAPLVVEADETLLEQAVSNVVYNAIRYNHAGGHVAVVLEAWDDARFRLRVLDDGPGIPEAELDRVVQRSIRGDEARTRHPDGRGLGLAITQAVVDLHGITLRFSRPDDGGLQVDFEGVR